MRLLQDDKEFVVKLADLRTIEEAGLPHEAHRPIDQDHLESLTLSDVATWPPIAVTKTDIGYIVTDGYHRIEAAKTKNLSKLKAKATTYKNEDEVTEAAFRANLEHGLPASKQSKSDYAYWLHVTYPELDQEEIAQRAHITQSTVSKAISRRERRAAREREESEDTQSEREPEPSGNPAARERQRVLRSCRSFARQAFDFLDNVGDMPDNDLALAIAMTLKSDEDREKLGHLGKVLTASVKQSQKKLVESAARGR